MDTHHHRPVVILAEDKGRFGRISNTRRAWEPARYRPMAVRQVVRKFVYVYAAVCPSLGKMTTLLLPWANTTMMSLFLSYVAQEFEHYFVIMLMDRAGWHLSRNLRIQIFFEAGLPSDYDNTNHQSSSPVPMRNIQGNKPTVR
jgi:hypothetical protein